MIARARRPVHCAADFLMRRFHHGGFRRPIRIKQPKDLGGKKVGVRAYSVTTGVWTRGIFVNEYGPGYSVTWVVVTKSTSPASNCRPMVHAPDGKSLASMMASGVRRPALFGRDGRAGPPTGLGAARADKQRELSELIATRRRPTRNGSAAPASIRSTG
jgi:4,5-dihydroxyphthalate decarboxylase